MKLAAGQYLGATLRRQSRHGLLLTLSQYAPGQSEPWHVHANPTMCVLLTGERRDQARRADWQQRPLTVVFHPTSEPHMGLVGPAGMRGLNVEFDATWLERHELRERDLGGYRPLDSVWVQLAALHLLAYAFAGSCPDADLDGDVLELLDPLVKAALGREVLPRPAWLRRAEGYIHDGLPAAIRLRDVAREAGVHPIHLARVFRRHHGCSVSQYVRALRIAEAGRLILHRRQPIAAAACATGFADQAHLCRWFGRLFGFSPRTLRSAGQALPF
jgi:AraC family transcriptional regulator